MADTLGECCFEDWNIGYVLTYGVAPGDSLSRTN